MNDSLGIWLARAEAQSLGVLLQARVGGEIYRPWLDEAVKQKDQFAAAYRRHPTWVMVAACGIAVRFLDGLSRDKRSDPAVVVLDEGGRYAVSLLAGHQGGANRLAYRVAGAIGALPVVTTATEAAKPLVAGVGCRKGVSATRIEAAMLHALGKRRLEELREVATVDLKAREPGLIAFCERRDLPLRVFGRDTLAARPWARWPSEWVRKNIGLAGVCEPCALLACARGRLLVPKTALDGVAVAIAEDGLSA